MVDDPAAPESPDVDAQLDVLRLTDEVIGLSAEIIELRGLVELATERATAAAEVAQQAEVSANAAAEQTQGFAEYLGEVTDRLGARRPASVATDGDTNLSGLSREELIARVEHLEAVLGRRSVQVALGMTKKFRGS